MNQVQIDFINTAARPQMELLVRVLHELDTFVADYDALQGGPDAIAEDATVMDDNAAGDGPRDDAPTLSGEEVKTIRNLSASMSAEVSAPVKSILIARPSLPVPITFRLFLIT